MSEINSSHANEIAGIMKTYIDSIELPMLDSIDGEAIETMRKIMYHVAMGSDCVDAARLELKLLEEVAQAEMCEFFDITQMYVDNVIEYISKGYKTILLEFVDKFNWWFFPLDFPETVPNTVKFYDYIEEEIAKGNEDAIKFRKETFDLWKEKHSTAYERFTKILELKKTVEDIEDIDYFGIMEGRE